MGNKTANEFSYDTADAAIANGKIKTGDRFAFRTILEISRCFGKNYKGLQRAFLDIGHEYYLWCPKVAVDANGNPMPVRGGWINKSLNDWKNFSEENTNSNKLRKDEGVTRITFAGSKESGQMVYRFIGVYVDDNDHPKASNNVKVYKRTAQEINLTRWLKASEKR